MRKHSFISVIFVFWGLILSVLSLSYLTWLQPSKINNTISMYLEKNYGIRFFSDTTVLSFFPQVKISLKNTHMAKIGNTNFDFSLEEGTAIFSWSSLFSLSPLPHTVELKSPNLNVELLGEKEKSDYPEKKNNITDRQKLLSSLPFVKFFISNGNCNISLPSSKQYISVVGINSSLENEENRIGKILLKVDSIHYNSKSVIDIYAKDTTVQSSAISGFLGFRKLGSDIDFSTNLQMAALDKAMGGEIAAPFRYFPMKSEAKLSGRAHLTQNKKTKLLDTTGVADLELALNMNDYNVPIHLLFPFVFDTTTKVAHLKNADIFAGDDHLSVTGDLTLDKEKFFLLKGKMLLHHFSLTRWFGFGQAMNAGLEAALDNITGEFTEFSVSAKGVDVPKCSLKVKNSVLNGSASCKDFQKARILFDIKADSMDLNELFPELTVGAPDMSHLPPPVLPSDDEVVPRTDDDVYYDIHVMADNASIMNFNFKDLDVHVIPAPVNGTKLNIEIRNFYNGKVASQVFLRDKVDVIADLNTVALAGFSKALAGKDAITGILQKGKVELKFDSGDGATILKTLSGTVNAQMANGNIYGESLIPYSVFNVQAKAAANPKANAYLPLKNAMNFFGDWKVKFAGKTYSIEVDAPKTSLDLSTTSGLPIYLRKQPLTLQLELDKNFVPSFNEKISMKITCNALFDSNAKKLEFDNVTCQNPFYSAVGKYSVTNIYSSPVASGELTLKSSKINNFLYLLGGTDKKDQPYPLRNIHISSPFRYSGNTFSLNNISGSVDASKINGNLKAVTGDKTSLTGKLTINNLDFSLYFPEDKTKKADPDKKTPLPFKFLNALETDLNLRINNMKVFKTPIAEFNLPIKLKSSVLSVPFSGTFFNGTSFSGSLTSDFRQNIALSHLNLSSPSMDMYQFTKSRGQKTLLKGTGIWTSSLSTKQKNWQDWKETLDGNITFAITNGALVSPSSVTTTGYSETKFSKMSVSGQANNGVITFKDFYLNGMLLDGKGYGIIKLKEENIDAHLVFKWIDIPEMPIHLYGNLYHPEMDYKLMGAVTGTVGNLGTSVFNLLGNVITAPFKILPRKQK